jgi:hypothetical protein
MTTSVVDVLLNGSPMAAFAVFLIYLYKTQQARMDALVERFHGQQDVIRKEYKEDVEQLRTRYDSVISSQNNERNRIKDSIEDRVKVVQQTLQTVHSTCQALSISQEVSKEEINALTTSVESVIATLKEMQNQAQIREIAKQAIKDQGD